MVESLYVPYHQEYSCYHHPTRDLQGRHQHIWLQHKTSGIWWFKSNPSKFYLPCSNILQLADLLCKAPMFFHQKIFARIPPKVSYNYHQQFCVIWYMVHACEYSQLVILGEDTTVQLQEKTNFTCMYDIGMFNNFPTRVKVNIL